MDIIKIIYKREIKSYFDSAIAYIFAIVFLIITCGLYMNDFFLRGLVEMDTYFIPLPYLMIFFLPALSMRLWAEERRDNTYELLMTIPIAILDAARDVRIPALLTQSNGEHQSLYEGEEGDKLAQVAPYLARLDKDSLLLASLFFQGWGNNWAEPESPRLQAVRRHLRHFLEVEMPDGKQVYFRFYDPRGLRTFLPTCNADESNQFFGPIKHYLIEDEQPDKLLQFTNSGHGADRKLISLLPREPSGESTVISETVERTLPMGQKAIPKPKR